MIILIICQGPIDFKKSVYNLWIFFVCRFKLFAIKVNLPLSFIESNLDELTCKGSNYNAHSKRLGLEMLFYLISENIKANCKLVHHLFDFFFGFDKNKKLLVFIVECKYFVLNFDWNFVDFNIGHA